MLQSEMELSLEDPENRKNYFLHLSKTVQMPTDHVNYLKFLKQEGFEPKVIYDIGSHLTLWYQAAKEIWPEAAFYLFEANEDCEFLYDGLNYKICLLSNEDDKEVKYYYNHMFQSGNSYYKEKQRANDKDYFDRFVMKQTVTLDTLVKRHGLPPPDFVKIDTQGSEVDIMAGGRETISKASRLIVELQHLEYNEGALLNTQSLPIMEQYGWKCVAPLFCNNGSDGDYDFVRVL